MDKFLVKHLFYFKLSVINFIIFLSISDTFSDPINLIGNISGNYCETADQYTMRNCRIPSGTTCFFGPGCVIKIDDTAGIICDGNLVIKGTALKPVIFEPVVNTYTWKGIAISTSGRVNLSFGNFIRAKDGISFSNVSPGNISNCKFINCLNSSIIGYCQGYVPCASPYESDRPISIGLVVQRCSFIDGAGCKFYSNGVCRTSSCMGSVTTFNIDIFNSLFINSPTGIYLQKGQCAFTTLKANNNVYLKCDTAVTASIGCEYHILNSLFVNNSIALFDSANTVNTTDYSCFYNNDTNLIGSSSLGRIIPDPIYICQRDFTYNIFCDPLIKDTLNCILDSLSPCIDHGNSRVPSSQLRYFVF